MKILVFGFSVTNQKPGYVEVASEKYFQGGDVEVCKASIGGLQPPQARHLVAGIVDAFKPQVLVVEIATAIFRLRPPEAELVSDHRDTVLSIFDICAERGIACGFLDLPQVDINAETDWLGPLHQSLCEEFGIAQLVVPLTPDTLTDNVHPNQEGKELYAEALKQLIQMIGARPRHQKRSNLQRRFEALCMAEIYEDKADVRYFTRGGYETDILSLHPHKPVSLSFPEPQVVVGLIVLMGPTTGGITVTMDGEVHNIMAYDHHCYYERIGGRPLPRSTVREMIFEQVAEAPSITLLKGTAHVGERLGGISHVLIERVVPDATGPAAAGG